MPHTNALHRGAINIWFWKRCTTASTKMTATFGLIHLWQVGPSIVLGNISQALTYRVRGNVALSVSLTAITNVVYIVVVPINLSSWGDWHPNASANGAGVVT